MASTRVGAGLIRLATANPWVRGTVIAGAGGAAVGTALYHGVLENHMPDFSTGVNDQYKHDMDAMMSADDSADEEALNSNGNGNTAGSTPPGDGDDKKKDDKKEQKKKKREWDKAREKYWKNRAQNAKPGEFTEENLEKMRDGKAPRHEDLPEVRKELHHVDPQRNNGSNGAHNLQEVWPWEHDEIDPLRHYNGPRPGE